MSQYGKCDFVGDEKCILNHTGLVNVKYINNRIIYMPLQAQNVVKEIEKIKSRLINIEIRFIENEKPEKEDVRAVKEALGEYRKGKTIPYNL